jgi:hypothetical protein
MPDALHSMLEAAVTEWDQGNPESTGTLLLKAIKFMQEKRMGYV